LMWEATGAVLAGGKNSRMHKNKALLVFENQTLLSRSLDKLRKLFTEVVVVCNQKDQYNLPGIVEITDLYPGYGPLGGVHAALKRASYERIFITACDLPFWELEVADFLMGACTGYDGVVPRMGNYLEPLLAVYTQRCLPAIEDCLNKKILRTTSFFPAVKINYIDRNLLRDICQPAKTFYNINTPGDFSKIKDQMDNEIFFPGRCK